MTGQPWDTDRPLTPDTVRAVAREIFPSMGHAEITWLGSGWDFDAYRVGDRVLRFPRRATVDQDLERRVPLGVHLMNLLSPLGVIVPLITVRDTGDAFPYRVLTNPWIEGVALDRLDLDPRTAAHLGEALSAIHGDAGAEAFDLPTEADHRRRWFVEAERMLAQTEPLLGDLAARVVEWVASAPELPKPYEGPLRFLHNDFKPDHVLVDPVTRRVAGILDWDDAAWGDPAYDFHVFRTAFPPSFTDALLDAYTLDVDDGLRERIDFFARCDAIDWLYESHLQGTDVDKHRRWVRNAFSG